MREVEGDLWEFPAAARAVTTNGDCKMDGTAIMGRGIALQAKERYPFLPRQLGEKLKRHGNHVFDLGEWDGVRLFSFPTKHHWRDALSDMELIKQSCRELRGYVKKGEIVAMPRPGCGNGGLAWAAVRPVLQELLPEDNFIIVWPK